MQLLPGTEEAKAYNNLSPSFIIGDVVRALLAQKN
jgi:hypothetical protein